MAQTYFISDIHLGTDISPAGKEREKLFLNFLKSIENKADCIFFVGDLFDFWYEYNYVIPKKQFKVLHQMMNFADKNIKMYYLAGNHDFYLGEFFQREFGIETFQDDWSGEINGKKFYLFHGDGVARKDVGYRILKKILRNKINQKIFSYIHPDFGIPFARFVSGSSRQYTNKVRLNDHDDYINYAKSKFEQGFDYVIMGHRHSPFEFKQADKKYINLGDWLFNYSYAVFNGTELKLIKEDISKI